MSISTKQALLLNNLIYLDSASGPYPDPLPFTGQTIGDWLDAFDLTLLYDPEGVPLPMTTKVEIRNVLSGGHEGSVLNEDEDPHVLFR